MSDTLDLCRAAVDPDGERRVIVVTLTRQRVSALYNLAVNPDGPGGDNDCIVRAYAMGRAQPRMPPGAKIDVEGIKRVVLH